MTKYWVDYTKSMQQLEGTQTRCRGMQAHARTRRIPTICNSSSRFFLGGYPPRRHYLSLINLNHIFAASSPNLVLLFGFFFAGAVLRRISNGLLLFFDPERIWDLYELLALYSLNASHAFCAFCGFCTCCLTYCPHSVPPKQFNFPKSCNRHSPTHAKCEPGRNDSPYQRFVRLDPYVYALKVRQDLANLHRT